MIRQSSGVRRCVRSHALIYTYQRYERTRSFISAPDVPRFLKGTPAHISAHLRKSIILTLKDTKND
jgi:hypothetical protein